MRSWPARLGTQTASPVPAIPPAPRRYGRRRGLGRDLLVLVALAGLVAMHGLTSNHDTGMLTMASAPPSATTAVTATIPRSAMVPDSPPPAGAAHAATASAAPQLPVAAVGDPTEAGSMMGAACLAVLALARLLSRAAIQPHPLAPTASAQPAGISGAGGGRPPPVSLIELCIARS